MNEKRLPFEWDLNYIPFLSFKDLNEYFLKYFSFDQLFFLSL